MSEGTVPVPESSGSTNSSPTNLTPLGTKLLYQATDSTHGAELWGLIAPVTAYPAKLDFWFTIVGEGSSSQAITLTNNSSEPISLTPTTASDFMVSYNYCTVPLAPGASCKVYVRFTPTLGGDRAGTLNIDYPGQAEPPLSPKTRPWENRGLTFVGSPVQHKQIQSQRTNPTPGPRKEPPASPGAARIRCRECTAPVGVTLCLPSWSYLPAAPSWRRLSR